MRLSQKLLLFVLAAAVVPLALAGAWLLRQAENELSARLEREQRALAAATAEAAGLQLGATLESLAQSALLIDWGRVSEAEAEGGLRLLAGQAPMVAAATLVAPSRPELAPFVARLEGRPALLVERVGLAQVLPLATLAGFGEAGQVAIGPVQADPAGAWMPVAIQAGPRDARSPMLVFALGLGALEQWLREHAAAPTELGLLDADGRLVVSSLPSQPLAEAAAPRLAHLRAGETAWRDAREQVAAARVPGRLGLLAFAAVPVEAARAPVLALRRTVLGGVGLTVLLLVAVALVFARSLTGRLERLAAVADAFAKGELSRRAGLTGEDELAALGQTFDAMGGELEAARARLLRWNDELRQKVDEATAELRAAQAQLLEAQKLAAIGQLGAGVAHEINNPLVGILGNAQLLLMDRPAGDPDFSVLKQIEDSAMRCREITTQLLRFSQKRGEVSLIPLDVRGVVKRAMALEQERCVAEGVTLEVSLPEAELRVDADPEQLEQVLAQLCTNARTAMKGSAEKRLSVTVRPSTEGAEIVVADTGKGIAPENLERVFEPFFSTKDVWTNIGLGLAVAYRVMEEHQGGISVTSEPGKGATFTLRLKAAGTTRQAGGAGRETLDAGGVGKGLLG